MTHIDYNHWLSLDYWTLEEAARLFCGLDPTTFNEIDYIGTFDAWVDRYRATKQLLERHDLKLRDSDNSQAKVDDLFDAAENKGIRIASALKALYQSKKCAIPIDSRKQKQPSSLPQNSWETGHFSSKTADAFDPLPIEGIAKIFTLEALAGAEANLSKWKRLSGKASENELISARITKASGRSNSTFNIALVANWLIKEGKIAPDQAARKLKNNLPDRSAELIDELFPDIFPKF